MTLNVQFSWQEYTTDGVQTIFPYPFYLKEKQDLAAYWEQMGTPPWHPGQPLPGPLPSAFYTLTGIGETSGGTLVTQTPLPSGRLTLRRGTPQNQLTDYVEGDAFPAESHETALDRLTLLVQDHEEVLSRASLLRVETGTPHRGLRLPDPQPNTVLGWDSTAQAWTLYPSGITAIPVDSASGIGRGRNTIALSPAAGASQVSGLVFPTGVLALAVTVWVETSLGQSQGLTHVGVGTVQRPDCWGLLSGLAAGSVSSAGMFQSHSEQPQASAGEVTLTAYSGPFDGTGTIYVTGHFQTFTPSQALGYVFEPGTEAGAVPIPGVPPASETLAGITRYGTDAETVSGTLRTVATHAAGVKAAIDAQTGPLQTADTTHSSQIAALQATDTTQTSQISALQATDATHTSQISTLDAKIPPGTPLSVARYAASGASLEGTPAILDASGNLGLRTTPGLGVDVVGTDTTNANVRLTGYVGASTGSPSLTIRKAQGTLEAPARVNTVGDVAALLAVPYVRNASDTADAFTTLARLRLGADTIDGVGRVSTRFTVELSQASGAVTERLRVTPDGNLLVGTTSQGASLTSGLALGPGTAPTTSPADAVQLWSADRGATAGKGSLHVRTEDGTSHVWGDLSGIGTLCAATLGSGASYQALSVKGSLLAVGQSSVQERAQALIAPSWVVSTDASRTARLTLSVYDATAAREGLRIETSGTAPMLGFYGSAAITKPAVTGSRGGNAALASALSALATLGLVTDSSTA